MTKKYHYLIEKISQEDKFSFGYLNQIFNNKISLVGGAVRDLILNKNPQDFDFTTPHPPSKIISILKKNKIRFIDNDAKFGTIIVVMNNKSYQITSLRKEVKNDGRHFTAIFIDDYLQDSNRRDFTINALYLDYNGNLRDYHGGIKDLEQNKVRFIGSCEERIKEDHLRILRFFRFSLYYAKDVDYQSLLIIDKYQDLIKKISKERIRHEIIKIINCNNNKKLLTILQIMDRIGIFKQIFTNKINIHNISNFLIHNNKFHSLIIQEQGYQEQETSKINYYNNIYHDSIIDFSINKIKLALFLIDCDNDINIIAYDIVASRAEKKYWLLLRKEFTLFLKQIDRYQKFLVKYKNNQLIFNNFIIKKITDLVALDNHRDIKLIFEIILFVIFSYNNKINNNQEFLDIDDKLNIINIAKAFLLKNKLLIENQYQKNNFIIDNLINSNCQKSQISLAIKIAKIIIKRGKYQHQNDKIIATTLRFINKYNK